MKQLREILIEFGQTTTAHGFSQLINSKGIIHRLFWITLIIGCNGYILMNMKKLVEYYQKKFISTNVYFKSNASPAFPVVVLCNANIIRKDAIDKILKEIEEMNRRKGRNTTATISLATITELQLEIYNEIFKYGTNFDDFFIRCKLFNTRNCRTKKYWDKIWHPLYGTCFVFNEDFHQNGTTKSIMKVPNVGPIGSLEMVLNISQELYNNFFNAEAGVYLYLGDQGSLYQPLTKGYSLSPGLSHILSLKIREIYRVDPFKNNTCVKHQRIQFYSQGQRLVTKYDPDLCAFNCLTATLLKYCNCSLPELPILHPNSPICNDSSKSCIRDTLLKISVGEIGCLKQCQPPCQEINYLVKHSFLQYLNLANQNKYNQSLLQPCENLMRVRIFFNTINVEVWEEKVLYKVENLLGDIGGQLGLFSGVSVMTIFEFVVFTFLFARYFLKGKHETKSND